MNRKTPLLITAIFIVSLSFATIASADEITVTRSISNSDINAGDSFEVSITLTTNEEVVTIGLQETIPSNWEVEEINSEQFTYSASNKEWLWSNFLNNVPAGTTTTIQYKVTVPITEQSGKYQIKGIVFGRQLPDNGEDKIATFVNGDSQIIVMGLESNNSNENKPSKSNIKTSDFEDSKNLEDTNQESEINKDVAVSSSDNSNSIADETAEKPIGYNNLVISSFLIFCLAGLIISKSRGY